MKKIKIALAAVALVAASALSAQELSDVNAKFSDAAAAVGAKDFGKAIPLFEQVIDEGADLEGAEGLVAEAKKHLPTAVFQMGGSQFQGGKLDEALASFSKAAELSELYGNPAVLGNARTWIGRTVLRQGADAFNNKDFAAAAAIFRKGYEGNPNDTSVAMNLAMSYTGMEDYENGNEIYRHIMALEEKDARFAEAAAEARRKFAADNLARAAAAAQAAEYAAAIAAADEALATVPDDAAIALLRLQAYNSLKDYAKVIELGDAAAGVQTDDEQRSAANFFVGAAYQNRENYAKAIEYYRKVVAGANVAAAKAQITELQKLVK